MTKRCIGIDVGGTTAKIGLLSAEGEILDKWEIPTRREEDGMHILPDIAASVRTYLDRYGMTADDLMGIGIGLPGPVTPDGNVSVCVNLGWKKERNPEQELSGLLNGIYVKAANDANVAALGEMWQGGGKGHKSIMLFTLGTGVGGGVVVDERVVAGFRGMGGEIGHIRVNFDEAESCNCGNHGCLEQYASATGIVRVARRALAASDAPSVLRKTAGLDSRDMLNEECFVRKDMAGENSSGSRVKDRSAAYDFSCKDVLDAAKTGDTVALSSVRTSMRYLALAMHYVSHITDPEIFVIGGGVSKAGQFLLDIIEEYYAEFAVMGKGRAEIGLATLGNDAGMYGAARLVLSQD